jgi:hypothetical protein
MRRRSAIGTKEKYEPGMMTYSQFPFNGEEVSPQKSGAVVQDSPVRPKPNAVIPVP